MHGPLFEQRQDGRADVAAPAAAASASAATAARTEAEAGAEPGPEARSETGTEAQRSVMILGVVAELVEKFASGRPPGTKQRAALSRPRPDSAAKAGRAETESRSWDRWSVEGTERTERSVHVWFL